MDKGARAERKLGRIVEAVGGAVLLFCRERGGHSVDMAGRSMESSVRGSEAMDGHVIRRRLVLFWDMPLTWPSVNVFRSAFGGNDTMPLIPRLLYQSLSEMTGGALELVAETM